MLHVPNTDLLKRAPADPHAHHRYEVMRLRRAERQARRARLWASFLALWVSRAAPSGAQGASGPDRHPKTS